MPWPCPWCRPAGRSIPLSPYLVPAHSLLLDLLKFPLQLALALQPLLGSAHIHYPPVDLLPVHVGHRLPVEGRALSTAGSQQPRLYSSPTPPVQPHHEQRPPWARAGKQLSFPLPGSAHPGTPASTSTQASTKPVRLPPKERWEHQQGTSSGLRQQTGSKEPLAFWASSCFSKLTNPKPFERPVLSIMTLTLSVFPAIGKGSICLKKGAH